MVRSLWAATNGSGSQATTLLRVINQFRYGSTFCKKGASECRGAKRAFSNCSQLSNRTIIVARCQRSNQLIIRIMMAENCRGLAASRSETDPPGIKDKSKDER